MNENVIVSLIILCALAVFALLLVLLYRSRKDRERLAKEYAQVLINQAEERAQIMLEQTPLVVMLWDKDAHIIDCNQEAVRVTGLSSKKEYMEKLFELTPDLPDGTKSSQAAKKAIALCLEAGSCRIPWALHHAITGELIPFDVTIARVKYKGEDAAISYAQDLREHNAAIEKIREADDRARVMIEQAPLVVMLWDKDAKILDCNNEALDILGLSSKQEYMERFFELTPDLPDGTKSSEAAKTLINTVLKTGIYRHEWVLNHSKSGEAIPFDSTLARIKYKDEYMVMSYGQDVRERNTAIAKMHEAEERAQIMLEQTPLVVMLWDKDANIIYCNQEAVRATGLSSKKEYMERLYELTPDLPDGTKSSEAAKKAIAYCLETGYCRIPWALHHAVTEELIPFDVTIARVKYKGEDVAISYAQDLRERNAAIEKIREAEDRAKAMIEQAPLIVMLWDKDAKIIDCNKEALSILGLSSKQEYIDRFFELAPDQQDGMTSFEAAKMLISKTLETGLERVEWVQKHAVTGEAIPFESTLARIKYKDEYIMMSYGLDVRERNAAIAKMREADEKTRAMFDAMPLCSNYWISDGTIVDCNDEAVKLFGLENKQEYIARFGDLSPQYQPDGSLSAEAMAALVVKAFKDGYCHFEWMMQKLSGELVPVEVTLIRIKHQDDYMVVAYFRDVRERNAAIAKIREADERARLLTEHAPLVLMLWDKNFQPFETNQEGANVFGLSSKQEYMERFFELVPEYQPSGIKSLEMFQKEFTNAFETGYAHAEWTMNHSVTGEPIPFDVTVVRIKYKDDYAVITYSQDLRELKSSIAKMREADERAQILFDTAPLATCMFDKDGHIIDLNQETVKMFGFPDKEYFYNIHEQLSPEYQPSGALSADMAAYNSGIVLEKGYNRFEWMHKKMNGDLLPTEVTLVHIKYKNEGAIAGYIRDLTEQKAMVQLAKQQAEAESANRAKSSFLATMSHEIRTPMNAILGITEIQLQNEEISEDIKNALNMIYNSGYSLLSIINDILDLSKIEAGKLELTQVNYDVASLISDTVHLNAMRFDSKPVEFDLKIAENIPTVLFGDELRIKQILNNLLSNAFKYTDSGKVSLSVAVEYDQQALAGQVTLVFRVSDTGQGMTQEQIDKLFTEYTRFYTETNRTVEGTGLGLNITRNLVHMMNGEISAESKSGKGSTFTVRLPQKLVNSDVLDKELTKNLMGFQFGAKTQLKKTAQITREYMPYGRILIVDDVQTNLFVARGLMAPYGLSIDTAANGFDAVERIKRGDSFDLILMDHFMPKMDGVEATKIIRGLGYTRSIVALTANAVSGQAEMFMENGFDDFISKPIDIRQLNAVLNRLVRDKYPAETVEAARRLKENLDNKSTAVAASQVSTNQQLTDFFVRDAQNAVSVLKSIILHINNPNEEEAELYRITVHGMKSALANIGENELSADALKLEQAAKNRDAGIISAETPVFLQALESLIAKIKPAQEDNDLTISATDLSFLQGKLLELKNACAAYDDSAAEAALREMKQKKWPNHITAVLDDIAVRILHSDFDEAADLAENALKG